ncbi:(2Fe-2S)-binding protein [Shimazuella kribbensis]|uniref:(2Fe-2S)-binding protein n=1 Tax=Shimazuella kribbensis TaxID=139808 RepID=UPI000423729C|nr:(2Fe-2S)-binding protein [Shimazuella kribbensis]
MSKLRIVNHPLIKKGEQKRISFTFNGESLEGLEGEPIAAALLAHGIRILRRHEESGSNRGLYCAIGHCMECRVDVQGKGQVRACLTPIVEGMEVVEGKQLENKITGREAP